MTNPEIDDAVTAVGSIIKVVGDFYTPLAVSAPVIMALLSMGAFALKTGIAAGTIVPDGKGGYVPSSNSHYNPITGAFI